MSLSSGYRSNCVALVFYSDKPTWVIPGIETQELKSTAEAFPWFKVFPMKSPFPFGHHHTYDKLPKYSR